MVKEKRILSYFIGWLLLGFIVCFIGLSNTYASEIIIPGSVQFYDNSGSSVSSVETFLENNSYYATFTTTEDGYGGLITFQLNTVLQKGRIYTIFILGGAESNGGTTRPSSKKYIGIGSNISNANSSYINSTNPASYSASSGTTADTSRGVYYTFVANQTGVYIAVPYTTQYTCSNCRQYFSGYTLEDLGSSENLSQDEVNNIINSQTAIIQNNINNMEQSIVDSNKETQDVIKDQFNTCRDSYNLYNSNLEVGSLSTSTGANLSSTTRLRTNSYIKVNSNTQYTISVNSSYTIQNIIYLFDNSYNLIGTIPSSWSRLPYTFTTDTNTSYIKVVFKNTDNSEMTVNDINNIMLNEGSTAKEYEPYGEEICSNKIDETNDKLDNIEDTLTNSSPTDMSGLGDSAGWLPAGPVDSILTLPLTMLNSLVTNLTNNSCQTMNIELPFVKENLILPCVRSLYDKIGITGTLFTSAGLIASAFILFNYLLALYKWVDDTLTMRENTMPGYFDDNWGGGA